MPKTKGMTQEEKKLQRTKDGYIAFYLDTPFSNITLKEYLIYRYAVIATGFKNWWFDNYFCAPLHKRNLWTKTMFKIGQIIIHKINKRYSFCLFTKESKPL